MCMDPEASFDRSPAQSSISPLTRGWRRPRRRSPRPQGLPPRLGRAACRGRRPCFRMGGTMLGESVFDRSAGKGRLHRLFQRQPATPSFAPFQKYTQLWAPCLPCRGPLHGTGDKTQGMDGISPRQNRSFGEHPEIRAALEREIETSSSPISTFARRVAKKRCVLASVQGLRNAWIQSIFACLTLIDWNGCWGAGGRERIHFILVPEESDSLQWAAWAERKAQTPLDSLVSWLFVLALTHVWRPSDRHLSMRWRAFARPPYTYTCFPARGCFALSIPLPLHPTHPTPPHTHLSQGPLGGPPPEGSFVVVSYIPSPRAQKAREGRRGGQEGQQHRRGGPTTPPPTKTHAPPSRRRRRGGGAAPALGRSSAGTSPRDRWRSGGGGFCGGPPTREASQALR